ncbi:FecR family protein [uncultured Aquimarina sp.]|uniref:FecR family protein n=1 Tax=uncultured Aquimarina sp. TaxID=575652 RepID=UPI00262A7178|nr:FecR family protein [uncultured Aquimarina sp.]
MKKEDLIQKWLDNEQLTKQESEAFKKLDVYDSYVKISETAKKFSAPEFDVSENMQKMNQQLKSRNTNSPSKNYLKVVLRIAAAFVIGIGLYFAFSNDYNTKVETLASQKTKINLPDESTVRLNSTSLVTYDEKNWNTKRKIHLSGEAYFNVAQGKKFDVETSLGTISVIGTRFNVKQRENLLEVTCYEGVVSVTINKETKYLRERDAVVYDSKGIKQLKVNDKEPKWYYNKSYFFKTPYSRVLKELEWQYGVEIKTKNIDPSIIFTGNFVHSDIELALKSITIPMRLKYVINNKTVTLFKE